MARYFEVSGSTSAVKLDTQGRGTMQYKVKNVSAAPIDGRAVLISLPATNPPSGVVQNGWVKIEPPTDRSFEKDKQETFVVKIEVPQKDRAKAGTYTFRLDAVTVAVPDRGDEGPAVAFTVEAAAVRGGTNKLAWLIPLIAVLVMGIGVGAWLLLRGPGGKVPDVTGKPVSEAVAALAAAKLTVDAKIDTVAGTPESADKVVTQNPAAGTKAAENAAVHLTVGASRATVPVLVGKTIAQAQTALSGSHLSMGTVTNSPNPNYSGGVVFEQSVRDGTSVVTNTSVDISVTPQTVVVPNVTNTLLNNAINQLKTSSLQLGNIYCDQLSAPIVNQTPAPNSTVPVGTAVNIFLPCTVKFNPGQIFLDKGTAAQKSIVTNAVRMTTK